MAKKKRKAARSKKSNPSSAPRKRHKRRRASNPSPKRSHKRRVRRAHVSNPKRTHKRSRAHKRNPGRGHHKRRAKRNPAIPVWAMGLLAGLAGVAAYTVLSVGTFQITKAMDPKLEGLERNRYIIGIAGTIGGVALAFVSPLIGAGIAASSAIFAFGTPAVNTTAKLFEPKPAPAKIAGVIGPGGIPYGIAGVFGRDGRPVMAGVVDADGRPQFMGGDWGAADY